MSCSIEVHDSIINIVVVIIIIIIIIIIIKWSWFLNLGNIRGYYHDAQLAVNIVTSVHFTVWTSPTRTSLKVQQNKVTRLLHFLPMAHIKGGGYETQGKGRQKDGQQEELTTAQP